MVNRGWVYSADASTVDGSRWRERDSAAVAGYVETLGAVSRQPSAISAQPRAFHSLDRAAIERAVGLSVALYVLVQTSDSVARDSVPVRLGVPTLDEGPHRTYAVQWFSFAVIAVVGGVVLLRKQKAEGGRQKP